MSSEVKTNCTVRFLARSLSFIHPLFALMAVEPIRLFIVEKNSKVRQALEARLSSLSRIEVVGTARAAVEGVRLYPELEPNVILLDAKTAGRPEDVAEVVSELNQQGPSVIVLTSYAVGAERKAALGSGAARYLLKDIDSAALIREIEALGKSRVEQTRG